MTNEYRPYTLIAELTYRCPLRCPYCSNPLDHGCHESELDTKAWLRLLTEAEELGVVQVNVTGGEPLVRPDLEVLIGKASQLNLYTNLITSGIPLTFERLSQLKTLGLNSVQVSIQSTRPDESDRIAGTPSFYRKLDVMTWARSLDLPLTMNVVLHRANIAGVADMIALAESVSAGRLELANAQYLGWALRNRAALLPTPEQLDLARNIAAAAKARLRGKMEILFVTPDYYSPYPKSCMDGWGHRFIVVNPEGVVLPCHMALTLPGLRFETIREGSLADIWHHSSGLNRFRGDEWLPDPCRTCHRRTEDFGGCRCQAFHLTGNASAIDPACSLSPDHGYIESARRLASHSAGRPLQFEYRSGRHTSDT